MVPWLSEFNNIYQTPPTPGRCNRPACSVSAFDWAQPPVLSKTWLNPHLQFYPEESSIGPLSMRKKRQKYSVEFTRDA
jgi:hypothetical protein